VVMITGRGDLMNWVSEINMTNRISFILLGFLIIFDTNSIHRFGNMK